MCSMSDIKALGQYLRVEKHYIVKLNFVLSPLFIYALTESLIQLSSLLTAQATYLGYESDM